MNTRDPPSKILLLIMTYLPPQFPLTNDYLFETFKHYGDIKKILIFERGKTNKAFVEYSDVKHAIQARRNMIGKSLTPQGGRLLIHYSRLKQLDLEVVDHTRGTQYESDNDEIRSDDKTILSKMTLPNNSQPTSLRIKLVPQEEIPNNSNCPSSSIEASPTKAIMETQLKQLEKILDDDYAQEIAKSTPQLPLDKNERFLQELLTQRPSKLLKVYNIDDRVTPRMLYNVFNRFGQMEGLLWRKNDGYATLQFVNKEQAFIAKELLNNIQFFGKEIRILFQQNEIILNSKDEYFVGSKTKYKIVPPTKTLLFSGVDNLLEIQDMVKLVGRIQEIKLEQNCIQITMTDIYEALKIISVFSDYDYKGNKLNLTLK